MNAPSPSEPAPATVLRLNEPFEATVVSVIIRDFIHLTERLSAPSLARLMDDYYKKVGAQVEQQKGVLTSISNHSMVVTFSGVEGEDVHARRALRCALAIAMVAYQTRFRIRQAFSDQEQEKFGVGIGIHSGELIFSEFGVGLKQYVATGHAVAVASLLAIKSKELDWNVVCSDLTIRTAGHGVQTRRRSLIGAAWLRVPVNVVEVIVVRGEEEGTPVLDKMLDSTLELSRGTQSGRFPAFAPELYVSAPNERVPTIPGYRFVCPIGAGGMSQVFLVERERDGARLAMKFAAGSVSEDSELLYRFVEEYGLLEQVRHPNVLQIFDQGVTDDVLFIVMEHLPGGTLRQHIGDHGLAFERAWGVLGEMMQALAEVHRLGIIHRDIKPENILLRQNGSPVLGDFGIARRICGMQRRHQQEYIVGTPYFMSPEQALGEDEDERTDIYSMGAVFFNMLTGEKPYSGRTLEDIVQHHLHAPVPKLPPHLNHLQSLLDHMMSKDRKLRLSALEVLELMDGMRLPQSGGASELRR